MVLPVLKVLSVELVLISCSLGLSREKSV